MAPTKPQKWNKHNKWPRRSTTLPTHPSRRTPPSKPRRNKCYAHQIHPGHPTHARHDNDLPTSDTGSVDSSTESTSPCPPRPIYRNNPPWPPIPLGNRETTLGQDRVLLVPWIQSENGTHELHMHLSQNRPSSRCHSYQHDGRLHLRRGLAFHRPSHPAHLTWHTSGI